MTNLSDLGQSVARFAPLLGSILAGPAGGAVGSIVAAKFGGDADNLDDLKKRIEGDTDAQIKLKKIESDHELQLQGLILQEKNNELTAQTAQMKIEGDNAANAREMNTKTNKWTDETTKLYWVFFTSCLIAGCIWCIAKHTVTGEEIPLVSLVLGGAMSDWKSIGNFIFGSSIGSKIKDKVLAMNQKTINS